MEFVVDVSDCATLCFRYAEEGEEEEDDKKYNERYERVRVQTTLKS